MPRHLDGVRVSENALALQEMDLVPAQDAAVDALEAIELAVLRLDQRRPVEAGAIDAPAEAARILELVGIMRAVDQQLLRDTAAHHAGPADPALLDDRDPRAVAAGQPEARTPPEPAPMVIRSKCISRSLQGPRRFRARRSQGSAAIKGRSQVSRGLMLDASFKGTTPRGVARCCRAYSTVTLFARLRG